MSDVYIVGIGMIKFGRFPNRTVAALGAEAAWEALDDAGISARDIHALYCGNIFHASSGIGQAVLKEIGQTGIPVTNVVNACATGATALRDGWMSIKAGQHDIVLCVGAEQMPSGLLGGSAQGAGIPLEGICGSGSMPCVFAELGMEHTRVHGTTFEQFARVSVKNHHHSILNPKAMYQIETPLDVVMKAEMISYPNTKLMCSVNVDGSAAAVLMSERKTRELGLMRRAVRIKASALTSDPYHSRADAMPDVNTATKLAAKSAYDMAGCGPEDLALIELHDCFATAELLHYENLGLCAAGEAGGMIDRGDTTHGGRIPVNVSGGLLSKGHPIAATGLANVYEVATHLRGEAGKRQVEGARLGMTHVLGLLLAGGNAACAVHILERV